MEHSLLLTILRATRAALRASVNRPLRVNHIEQISMSIFLNRIFFMSRQDHMVAVVLRVHGIPQILLVHCLHVGCSAGSQMTFLTIFRCAGTTCSGISSSHSTIRHEGGGCAAQRRTFTPGNNVSLV